MTHERAVVKINVYKCTEITGKHGKNIVKVRYVNPFFKKMFENMFLSLIKTSKHVFRVYTV